jgi:uncharacterized membrane protein YcgQ (UPF0703/DUF1980 family)
MSQPPTPSGPPRQPLPQPQPLPQQGMPSGGSLPPHGPIPVQEEPKTPKRFGWPTLIIASVVALGVGIVGGSASVVALGVKISDNTGTTAAPQATVTATKTAIATEPTSEPTETKQQKAKNTTTTKPKPEPVQAVRVSKRQWAKIVKKPESYKGNRYIIYGQVTQFDSATGDDTFLADTAHRNTMSYGFFDGDNALLTGSTKQLDDLVEDDVFRASVTVLGKIDNDTQTGGNTTVPLLEINSLKVIE